MQIYGRDVADDPACGAGNMAIIPFRKVLFDRVDHDGIRYRLTNLVDNLFDVLGQLTSNPIVDNVFLENKTIGTSNTTINHTLGRTPRGWYVVGPNASATVYEVSKSSNNVILVASAAVTCGLVVF